MIKNNLTTPQIILLSFLLAFCSFFYELSFAQLLSSLLGGTYLQYAIAIGLFTFSLGMGTLLYEKLKSKYDFKKIFIITEMMIIFIIFISPWTMILLNNLGIVFLLYVSIVLIGVLTGVELPLLINQNEKILTKTLAVDYCGMILSSISFPLLFFPKLGLVPGIYFVCMINIFSIIVLLTNKKWKWIAIFLLVAFILLIFSNINELNHLSSAMLELRHD